MKKILLYSFILVVIFLLISTGSTLLAQCSKICRCHNADTFQCTTELTATCVLNTIKTEHEEPCNLQLNNCNKQENHCISNTEVLMNIDIEEFKKYLEERKIEKEMIEASIKHLQDFDAFLQKNGKSVDIASYEDFYKYSAYLINTGQNSTDTYISILRYAFFKKMNILYVAALEVLDGSEVFENLSNRLIEEFGENFRNEILKENDLPPLGLHPKNKPEYTKKIIQILEEKLGTDSCTQFLNKGLRDRYEESRKPDRELFLNSKNIDEFLEQKHKNLLSELERCYNEGRLFFTQEITKEVLEFVRNNPYIESGVRKGNKIIVKKIPYKAKEYFKETDKQKKRYYYCHCPWVRESLIESDITISPVFCNCSAGFYKAYWEIVLDQTVRVEVLESVLQGDSICKFKVHLPKNILNNLEQ
jgi:hypothetical protein